MISSTNHLKNRRSLCDDNQRRDDITYNNIIEKLENLKLNSRTEVVVINPHQFE